MGAPVGRVASDDGRRASLGNDLHIGEAPHSATVRPPCRHCGGHPGGRGPPRPTRCAPDLPGRGGHRAQFPDTLEPDHHQAETSRRGRAGVTVGTERRQSHGSGRSAEALDDGDGRGGITLVGQRHVDDHIGQVLGHGSAEPDRAVPTCRSTPRYPGGCLRAARALREPRTRPRLDDGLFGGSRAARCRAASELCPRHRGAPRVNVQEHGARTVDLLAKSGTDTRSMPTPTIATRRP